MSGIVSYNEVMDKPSKLTILWHSVAPWIPSGYGKISGNILKRFVKSGYKVIESCYYGLEPGGILNYDGIFCVSAKEGQFGVVSGAKFAQQFKVNTAFLATDWWAFGDFPKMMPNACLYGPMDHVNYPDEIKGFTSLYYRLVALCEFQKDMLKNQMGLKSTVIPHGVDTNLYHPMDKELVKQKHGMKGRFVFGTVNANSDKEMGGGRKSWGVMMKAMRYFLDQNPDVKDTDIAWMCHTDPSDPRGLPLISMAHKFRLDNVVKFSHPEMHKTGFSEAQMAELYNCFDIFYGTSKREGFGMTFIEAESCGVPVIGHDFASVPELVRGHGWLCKSVAQDLNMELTPILADTAIPDVYSVAECIKDAYFNDTKREQYGKESREFALQYDWDRLHNERWIPFLEQLADDLKPKNVKQREINFDLYKPQATQRFGNIHEVMTNG